MTVELITGHAGSAHVSAADVGWLNAGTYGTGKYVLDTQTKFACFVQSANLVTVGTGDAVFQGRHVRVSATENVSIDNGAQGMNRNDIICIKYEYNSGTGVETASLAVVKGTATSGTPSDPTIPSGNIFSGSTAAYMPLWRIPILGITLGTPVQLFNELGTIEDALINGIPAERIDSGTLDTARIPNLGSTYLKRQPSSTSELPQNTGSTVYPIGLDATFANDGKVSYMTTGNFRAAIGVGTIGTKDSLSASDIPNIPASKIASGTLPISRGGTGQTHGLQWVQLTTGSGSAMNYSLSGYEEVMVVCQHSTDYVGSVVLPVAALTSTAKKVYLSGGYGGSGVQGRSASISMTTTKGTPSAVIIDGSNVSSSCTWQIYAR